MLTAKKTREKYRPVWRQLADKQVHEFETFEALERSFFGRTKNILKTIRQNGSDEKSNLARAFRIISSADDRRKHLEKAQSRERTEVQIEINESLNRSSELAKAKDVERLALARANFKREMMDFRQERAQDLKGQGESWRRRNAERNAVFQKAIVMNRESSSLRETYDRVAEPDPGNDDVAGLISEYGLEFDRASQGSEHASTDATSKQKQKQ